MKCWRIFHTPGTAPLRQLSHDISRRAPVTLIRLLFPCSHEQKPTTLDQQCPLDDQVDVRAVLAQADRFRPVRSPFSEPSY